MQLPLTKDTVIDGGGLVTLDGGHSVGILRFDSPNFQATETRVTVQHLAFDSQRTGAVLAGLQRWRRRRDLRARWQPDRDRLAVHRQLRRAARTRRRRRRDPHARQQARHHRRGQHSVFDSNTATGRDANNNDASMCTAMNNGQNEIGSGGNGGTVYSDGNSVNVVLCGDKIVNNAAGTHAFGGGLFFTSNNFGGTLTIADTTMAGNTGGHWTTVQSGSTTNAGTAVGTNTKSLTITNSMLQGVP